MNNVKINNRNILIAELILHRKKNVYLISFYCAKKKKIRELRLTK